MPEGLSPTEVGKEIAEHREASAVQDTEARQDRVVSIIEAVILSAVAVLAAYSGFAAAKWATESSVSLARASTQSALGNRFDTEAIVTRTLDYASFNAWFTAFIQGNARGQRLAVRRFRPGFRTAFKAWLATDPEHNPNAPPGPSYMPQYVVPQHAETTAADARANQLFAKGDHAGSNSDDYIRDTVFLATVLFLVGISSHFRIRPARYAVIVVAIGLLAFAVIQLAGLPQPP